MTKFLAVNERILSPKLQVIDENGKSIGVLEKEEALYIAYNKGLDLVLVAPKANPPVAKIMDYGKYKYEMEKQQRKQKKMQKKQEMKEIRLSLRISERDLEVKIKKIREFLEEGNKVKVSLPLSGRELAYRPKAIEFLKEVNEKIGISNIEKGPGFEGKNGIMIISKK